MTQHREDQKAFLLLFVILYLMQFMQTKDLFSLNLHRNHTFQKQIDFTRLNLHLAFTFYF